MDLKPDPKPTTEPADELDGIRKRERQQPQEATAAKKKETPVSAREQRVWPLPDGSFVFTQAFGCVPQLGNLYLPGPGCPADRPVIHTGIDLAAPEGTVFYAAASGWVTLAGYDRPTPDANTRIIIQHDGRQEGYSTEYLHWVASYVAVGDYVHAGEPIGEVGNVGFSTGPHLHFSVIDLATASTSTPWRWLPPDNNSGAYKGRLPSAQMRLPAGTTAGQPEEADPNPAPAPTKVKVPKSPPQEDASVPVQNAGTSTDMRCASADGQASTDSTKHGRRANAQRAATRRPGGGIRVRGNTPKSENATRTAPAQSAQRVAVMASTAVTMAPLVQATTRQTLFAATIIATMPPIPIKGRVEITATVAVRVVTAIRVEAVETRVGMAAAVGATTLKATALVTMGTGRTRVGTLVERVTCRLSQETNRLPLARQMVATNRPRMRQAQAPTLTGKLKRLITPTESQIGPKSSGHVASLVDATPLVSQCIVRRDRDRIQRTTHFLKGRLP